MEIGLTELAVGIGLALVVLLAFRLAGIQRERGSYAVLLAAIATPYVMWAVDSPETGNLLHIAVAVTIIAAAILGARFSFWILVAGFVAHGLFDGILHFTSIDAPTPDWYAPLCFGFDLTIALGLIGFLVQGHKVSDMS